MYVYVCVLVYVYVGALMVRETWDWTQVSRTISEHSNHQWASSQKAAHRNPIKLSVYYWS